MATTDLETRTRYDPGEVESRVLARWLESGLFHPEAAGTAEENYSIAIPLPNVTGALHMGHALNGSVQDTLIRLARMRGKRTKWIFGTDHAGIGTQTLVERALIAEGTSREELGREKFVERVWRWRDQYGSTIVEQFKAARRLLRLRGREVHARPALRRGGPEGLRRPVREGLDLPRQLHGQLGPGLAVGDLRPRGRAARGHRHPLLRRLSARERPRVADDRDRAAGDDAGRHRDRRPPRRRPLHAAGRRGGDPAARRPPAADHRRPVREARVRHRRAEDHARARPERLRDRARARARRGHRHRRGRAHDRRRPGGSRA